MRRKLWVVTGALLAVAAVEFGLAGSASAFFPWQHRKPDPPACGRSLSPCRPTSTATRVPTATPAPPQPPVSPPVCQPDAVHGHDAACDGQPASIQLTPDPLTIHCDGSEQSRVTVRVTDSRGRAVPDGTTVYFGAFDGSTDPFSAQTRNGIAATSVTLYGDLFKAGGNVTVEVGPLEAAIRIRCFPNSNGGPPSPPPCDPSGASPPSVSPPCATPTALPGCWPYSPPSVSPPCGPTPYPTPTPSWPCDPSGASPPSAYPPCLAGLALSVASSSQATSTPFDVTVAITRADATWAGYSIEIAYDRSVLRVNNAANVSIPICNNGTWATSGNPSQEPTIILGCVFQQTTAAGPTATITFQCLKDGSSVLHLVTLAEDSIQGSTLFDENAVFIPTELTDGPTITCGAGGTSTATPTGTALVATLTATAKTALAGWTETALAGATNTPTTTPVPTATNTPVPIG
jgi:hypothetical protein